ncbi:hypothetical protein [Pseudonocardia sp. GCM10023141]|uniref:hypothetical protein n=1 Tax=Pseudonocardia sp. GCM10023141 TaxID=3252653 RepID=UPI003622021F
MLGFRSLLRTHDTPDLIDVSRVELAAWLKHKRYDSSLRLSAEPIEIGRDVQGSMQHHTDEASSQTMRARIVENTPSGTWTSELTVHNSPTGNRGWVWLDIHSPDRHGWTATPRLARRLVRALPARDGSQLLNAHPRIVRDPDVEKVVAALVDPARRGLAFVAASPYETGIALWRDAVESLLDDTEGIANAWVLSPSATDRFNYLVQPAHQVSEGFVRTFLPGVDIGNALDAERHRYLTRRSLERESSRAVRRLNLGLLETLARTGQRADSTKQRISTRLRELQDSVDDAGLERDLALEELAIEQRERADAEEDRAEAERRLRYLRKQLVVVGRADVAWTEPELDIRDIRPDTFVDLLERLAELEHVTFTGDGGVTLDLDKHGNSRSWAGKTWDALLALDDYARISLGEGFAGDVSAYLADTPAACRTFSGNRHASTESGDVQRNPQLRNPRELPVPAEVEPSGRAFMGAHFKIAQSATISPRLHYLDATARTRVIYVGYIGPHLPLSTS